MLTINPELDLLSLAKLSEVLQASPNQIERAVVAAGVGPTLRLNGVAYYADSSIAAIREHLTAKQNQT